MTKYTCPCCGYKTLTENPPGTFVICPICYWEDDNIQFNKPDYSGGANKVSLIEAQKNYINFGACDKNLLKYVRKPNDDEEKDFTWSPFRSEEFLNDEIQIDLGTINSIKELHLLFKKEFFFPDFYGMNWDAFWDSITGFVVLPRKIIFKDWDKFITNFPRDAKIMKQCFEDLKKHYYCEVIYK